MTPTEILISELSPDPHNARRHEEKSIEAIKNSLQKFGQQKPIVVNLQNIVIAGNGVFVDYRPFKHIPLIPVSKKMPKSNEYGLKLVHL
jgi:hypothetical protein